MVSSGIGTTDFVGINPHTHCVLFCEVMQTEQTKFRRHRTLLLNRIFAVLSTNSICARSLVNAFLNAKYDT